MRSRADNDFATPLRRDARSVALEIDGRVVAVPEGTSVIRAAAEAGIHVPKLCATDSLEPFGSCRLCLVEIDGQRGYPASCTTPVRAGMKVRTESPGARAPAARRDGVVHFGSSARLPDLSRQRQLRTAGHGGCGRSARGALPQRRRRESSARGEGSSRIRISLSIRRNASCARDASARARKCRAPSR